MIEDLIKRHYDATCKRGQITPQTKTIDFILKMVEEDNEALREMLVYSVGTKPSEQMIQEIIDKCMVGLNFLQHNGVDIELALCRNTMKQENRKD
jgi:hypothetical protein